MTLDDAIATVRNRLLDEMRPEGFWEGRLASSALSTATAISAMSLAGEACDTDAIKSGAAWLAKTQNPDGGWGDTPESPSNLATSMLVLAAMKLSAAHHDEACLDRAWRYIHPLAGRTPEEIAEAVRASYGKDRTFSTPILMNCALAGLVRWDEVPHLPFELAVLPHGVYGILRLRVVSYALPALIAVGLAVDGHRRCNVLLRGIRNLIAPLVLKKLRRIQPENGGFLEAVPLTSFVAMALASASPPGRGSKSLSPAVTEKCLRFLRQSRRTDGSWAIDSNLSVWLTTSAASALAEAGGGAGFDAHRTRNWIARRQYRTHHPYTNAQPGGWAWTHLPGGVPDADDTAGAIIALSRLPESDPAVLQAGGRWLLRLQNKDGGWPTFCRGWGQLPFDKSSPDLTAHALRALNRLEASWAIKRARERGMQYLSNNQNPDGSWIPLWFGNQGRADHGNPVVGTARVLRAMEELDIENDRAAAGMNFLLRAQNRDGGWGGDAGLPSTIEETALVVSALAGWGKMPEAAGAIQCGVGYLIRNISENGLDKCEPIGLYFARLWYSEKLYPIIWTLEALGRVKRA